MDQRNLIHPMTAGDLVESAFVVAQKERGMTSLDIETRLLEVLSIDAPDGWPADYTFAAVTFRDQQTGGTHVISLKATTPLLVTGISL